MIRFTRGATTMAARAAAAASASAHAPQLAPIVAVGGIRAFRPARAGALRFASAADAERESRAASSSSEHKQTEAPQDQHASEATSSLSDQQQKGAAASARRAAARKPSSAPENPLTPANLRPDPRIDDAINRAEGRRDFSTSVPSVEHVPQPITPVSDFDTVAEAAAAPHIHEDFALPSYNHFEFEFAAPKPAAAMSEAPTVEEAIHKQDDATRSEAKAPMSKDAGTEEKGERKEHAHASHSSSRHSHSIRGPSSHKERSPFDPFSFLSSLPLPRPSTIASQLPPGPLRDLAKVATPENLQKVANGVAAAVAGGGRSSTGAKDGATHERSTRRDEAHARSSSGSGSSSSSSRGGDVLGTLFPTPSTLLNLASTAAKGLPGLVHAMPDPAAVIKVVGHVTSLAGPTQPDDAKDRESERGSGRSSSSSTQHRPRGARRPAASKPLRSDLLAEMLRVDHAGEYGAQRIYDGQLFVLGAGKRPGRSSSGQSFAEATSASSGASPSDVIEEMRAQEIEHLRTLERLLPQYRVRPTALLPLWNVAGFALGAGSAMLGPKAAMACTVAVEDVITSHYNDQLRTLNAPGFHSDSNRQLKDMIKRHRDDEEHHKAIGLDHKAEEAPAYKFMTQIIQAGCQAAIWISKKV